MSVHGNLNDATPEHAKDAQWQEELRHRAIDLLRMTDGVTVAERADEAASLSGLRSLDGHLAVRSGELRDRLLAADVVTDELPLHGVSTALADVQTLRFEIRDFLVHERLRRLERLEEGLATLRRVHDPDLLLHRVCHAVVDSCGFDRVMLSRVEGSTWRPWRSYAVDREDAELPFRDWMAAIPEISLDHMLLESQMVRRREAAIVADATSDPRVSPALREASGLLCYVAAPIMPEDRVVGFLHADYRRGEVTPLDCDILAAFAHAFDLIFERAVLLRRLAQQRDQVRATIESVSALLDDLASAEIELATLEHSSALPAARPLRAGSNAGVSHLESLLTRRELEVLALMATGATNDRIAERLVISSDTVKSHVKHILRKLGAENRAEAIAQYLRLTLERGES
jgi:DNA-binding CsgD family transcriptional regulator/GrpB-like predicted nucleotidyltransferase (UPF0157 family)